MNNFAVCLQIDSESYEWGLSGRSGPHFTKIRKSYEFVRPIV